MFTKVMIESAGDHKFDMPHLRRSGAEDLIKAVLTTAGFSNNNAVWRVRINEKQQCSSLTPPITFIRHKKWGIYARIKPGDNNTCHNVTILVPTGQGKAESVYQKLKNIEKLFNRNWKKVETPISLAPMSLVDLNVPIAPSNMVDFEIVQTQVTQETPTPTEAIVIFEQVAKISDALMEETVTNMGLTETVAEEQGFDLQEFLQNPDNIKAICLCLYTMKPNSYDSNASFMEKLCDSLGISLNGHKCGAMMRSIVNRGLCQKSFNGRQHIGYTLTRSGEATLLEDGFSPKNVAPVKSHVAKPATVIPITPVPLPLPTSVPLAKLDRAKILRDLLPIAQDVVQAAARMKEINDERSTLIEKLKALDKEEQEICELVEAKDVDQFVHSLSDFHKVKK